MSLMVDGVLRPGYAGALSSKDRACSIVCTVPFVATLMASTPRVSSCEAGTVTGVQTCALPILPNRGPLNPSAGNAAAVAPAVQRPRAGTVANCAHETTPAGIGVGGPNILTPRSWNVAGMVSPGSARTTSTPWTPGIALNCAVSGTAGAAGPGRAVPPFDPGPMLAATCFDADTWLVSTFDSAALPNRVRSLAFCVVIATVAAVAMSRASTRPLTARKAAPGSSARRRAAISVPGRL